MKDTIIDTMVLDRILEVLNLKNDSELARFIGISSQAVSKARNTGKVPPQWVLGLASRFNLSTDFLFFGCERGIGKEESQPSSIGVCDVDLRLIPMVEARISAGQGSFETSGKSERSYAFRMDFLLRKGDPDQMIMMRVAGDSMEPEIHDGDVVLLDQSQRDVLPGRIYAVGFEDAIYLKRIDKEPGKVILKSMNPNYRPVMLDVREDCAEQFRVIGKVLWSGREYR